MTDRHQADVTRRFFVSDLPSASTPATRLRKILDSLQKGSSISALSLAYLKQQGLFALHDLAQGEISYPAFCEVAAAELANRAELADNRRSEEMAVQRAKDAEDKVREIARAAEYERQRQLDDEIRRVREADPKYIAKLKNQQLRSRYGIDEFVEDGCFIPLMNILRSVDAGNRLSDEDLVWLKTVGKHYYTEALTRVFHEREAEFHAVEYKRTKDAWNAVNASGHFRKCGRSSSAHDLLNSIPVERRGAPKLKSAICTTHGGALRDLKRLDEALSMGSQAHTLTPKDFRPCTLLGAVNMELGNLEIGLEWYRKAEERGASERSVDDDLRGILARADHAKRAQLKAFLLREDAVRYKWVASVAGVK